MTEHRMMKIREIFKNNYPIVKTCVLRSNKVCSRDIIELMESGCIVKVKTGYYAWKSEVEKLIDIELVQSIIPTGVISLQSAAQINGLANIDNCIRPICMTISNTMIKPTLPENVSVRLFYCSEDKLSVGLINHQMQHRKVNIYNRERTICDFFKFPDKVENNIAKESLKLYMQRDDKNIQRLLQYASLLRVQKYIKPLVEVLQ